LILIDDLHPHEALAGVCSVIVTGPASRSTIANEFKRVAVGPGQCPVEREEQARGHAGFAETAVS